MPRSTAPAPGRPVPRGERPVVGVAQRRAPFSAGLDPFRTEFLAGLEAEVTRSGGDVLLQLVADRDEELACFVRWAGLGGVRGAVIMDVVQDDPRLPLLERLGTPTVVLGHADGPRGAARVEVDDAAAMRTAVRALVELGHRSLGRVAGPAELWHTRVRTEAFDATLLELGASGRSLDGDYTTRRGREATRELLSEVDRPTAVVYDNDAMALGGLGAAEELGLAVPRDVSLLAWDDSPPCQLAVPALSVVGRDVPALGAAAGRALLDLMAGGRPATVVAGRARVVVRATTAPPAAR
ncbi:LacI family DNA-binding transcriptional regulator [Frigoribacterium salinisoli]